MQFEHEYLGEAEKKNSPDSSGLPLLLDHSSTSMNEAGRGEADEVKKQGLKTVTLFCYHFLAIDIH